jgi:Fic family protein
MVEKDQYLRILKESRESEFKSSEVAALFNISQRQATRVLKKLVNQRKLAQIKKGRSSYYKLIA